MRRHNNANVRFEFKSIHYKYFLGIHDPKFCGEIITNDNRRMRLEIPGRKSIFSLALPEVSGWPSKRKYDIDHKAVKSKENFDYAVCCGLFTC